ncbi:hypothetical protein CBP36_20130 (plasmid) [Acidovorax carolinensis]|uniref:Uncharacterized protein n=1 Tax=Acidovorax carolinensis TaxID=553814 RepID=A0A240UIF4_9BURK|nr:hypothetical protein [Acidovorax carolinensis]ART57221.1 hypothetical protein CBP35_20110 [Acidovorax carolinensis]ART61277.1 hypothetical protein CBP36_20130 [Acidovorax carolinensis]
MLFHKTLHKERMTCAGAVGVLARAERLPVVARLGLALGAITPEDIQACAAMVTDPSEILREHAPG